MRINLNDILEKKAQISNLQQQLNHIIRNVSPYQVNIDNRMHNFLRQLKRSQLHAGQIIQFLDDAANTYEQLESQLQGEADTFSNRTSWNHEYAQFTHAMDFKNQSKFSLSDSLTLKGTVTGTVGFSFYHAWKQYKKGNVNAAINANIGYANVSGKCEGVLFQNKQFQPRLDIDIDAKAAIGNVNGKVGYTNGQFGIEANGALDVGVISAKTKAVLSKEEVSLKVDYGVAAVRGKAHGRISLFGFHLDTTVEGEMLALGGGAEFSKGKTYVEIGGKLSLFAGLGFKIRLSRD